MTFTAEPRRGIYRSAAGVKPPPKRAASTIRSRTTVSHDHLGRIKAMACACCEAPGPSDAHHIREGQGGAQRAADWLAIPLCKECHQGTRGVHGDKSAMRLRKLTELDMLAGTIKRLTT